MEESGMEGLYFFELRTLQSLALEWWKTDKRLYLYLNLKKRLDKHSKNSQSKEQ